MAMQISQARWISLRPEWRNRTPGADETYDISTQEVFAVTLESGLRYADIVFTVWFKPWFIPINMPPKEFRFFTQRLDGGVVEWHPKPLAED
jgi:hypothetical protein